MNCDSNRPIDLFNKKSLIQIHCCHRCNNRRDWGRLVPQLLGWGTNNVLVPQLLAVVFKKQEISQQVGYTRMQDLASEF